MNSEYLHRLAKILSDQINVSEATIGNKSIGNARIFEALRSGSSCTIRTYNRVVQWFSNNWPVDLAWPSDVPRPDRDGNE